MVNTLSNESAERDAGDGKWFPPTSDTVRDKRFNRSRLSTFDFRNFDRPSQKQDWLHTHEILFMIYRAKFWSARGNTCPPPVIQNWLESFPPMLSRSPFPLSITYHRPIPIAFFSIFLFSSAYAPPNIADLASLFSLTCPWYRVRARCFLAYFKRYVEARHGILGIRDTNERSYAGTCMLIFGRDKNAWIKNRKDRFCNNACTNRNEHVVYRPIRAF